MVDWYPNNPTETTEPNSDDQDCLSCEWYIDNCVDVDEDLEQVCPVILERFGKRVTCVLIGESNPDFYTHGKIPEHNKQDLEKKYKIRPLGEGTIGPFDDIDDIDE